MSKNKVFLVPVQRPRRFLETFSELFHIFV